MSTSDAAAQFNVGDKVKLCQSVKGSEEDTHVYGPLVPQSGQGRTASLMPVGSEVIIHKIKDVQRPRTSTAGANEPGGYKMYSLKQVLGTKFWRFKATGDIIQHRIPHNSLSKTKGGRADQAQFYTIGDYVWVIVEHSWNYQGTPVTVKVNKVIQIAGRPLTITGQQVNPSSARRSTVTYDFKYTTEEENYKVWTSNTYHLPDAFDRVQ